MMLRVGMVLASLLTGMSALADEIVFPNGDRISGRLVSLKGGRLTFATEMIGDLHIDAARVETWSTQEAVTIHLTDGTIVTDVLVPEPGGLRTEGRDPQGARELTLAEIEAINPPPPKIWSGEVFAGAEFERGNSHTVDVDSRFKLVRETQKRRITLRGKYEAARFKDQVTRNSISTERNLQGILKYDRFLGKRFYWTTSAHGEKDDIAGLNLRFIQSGGIGYRWLNSETWKLSTEAGLAWTHEDYDDGEQDDEFWGLIFQWDLLHAIADNLSLFHQGTWRPSIEDSDVHLVETESGLRIDLSSQLFFDARIEWDWNSRPAEDKERQDVDYILGVGYKF